MSLFDDNCRIVAEYKKETGGVSIKVRGDAIDLLKLLTTVTNQIAEKLGVSGAQVAASIGVAADMMRRAEGEKITTDLGAIQRAKDKRDGN